MLTMMGMMILVTIVTLVMGFHGWVDLAVLILTKTDG